MEKWNEMEAENRGYKIEERNKEPIKTNWSSFLHLFVIRFVGLIGWINCVVFVLFDMCGEKTYNPIKIYQSPCSKMFDISTSMEMKKKKNKEIVPLIICYLNDVKLSFFNYLYFIDKKFFLFKMRKLFIK